MHHLRDINLFWEELYRVLTPGGVAIIEFANKNHILAIIRNLLKGRFSFLQQEVLQVSHKQTSQGMKDGQVSIMYNFSPSYIKRISRNSNFEVQGLFACSFLRSTLLKKLFPVSLLVALEIILQRIFGWLLITPSVFVVLRKPGDTVYTNAEPLSIARCPVCGSELKREQNAFVCDNAHSFEQNKPGIIDLRDPRPEEVDF